MVIKVTIAITIFVAAIVSSLFWINRFEYVKVNDVVYRINRWTGSAIVIHKARIYNVRPNNPYME